MKRILKVAFFRWDFPSRKYAHWSILKCSNLVSVTSINVIQLKYLLSVLLYKQVENFYSEDDPVWIYIHKCPFKWAMAHFLWYKLFQ